MESRSRGSLAGGRDGTPRLWLAAVATFGVGDLLTTGVGLSHPRIVEAGPVPELFPRQHGLPGLVGLKVLVFGTLFALWTRLPEPHRVGVPLAIALVGVVVVVWNTLVIAAVAV